MSQPQAPRIDVKALWGYVVDQVKARIALPALFRALEAARPITVEGDELILGFGGEGSQHRGLLMDNRYLNLIEQILEAGTRRRLKIRIIEGETLQDWESVKQMEGEAVRLQQQTRRQFQQQTAAGATWEDVSEQVVRKLSDMPNRALASVQGRFLEDALEILAEAYGRLMPASPSELEERSYSRALDRFSERVGVPASLLAHMVHLRVRSRV
jgi:hypothetical protein